MHSLYRYSRRYSLNFSIIIHFNVTEIYFSCQWTGKSIPAFWASTVIFIHVCTCTVHRPVLQRCSAPLIWLTFLRSGMNHFCKTLPPPLPLNFATSPLPLHTAGHAGLVVGRGGTVPPPPQHQTPKIQF